MDYIEWILHLDADATQGEEQQLIVALQELCKAYIDGDLHKMLEIEND